MSNYLIKKETLDNIAAQSNELMGKEVAVFPAEIIADLTEVNSEVDSQSELIAQIASALEGKAGGGDTVNNIEIVVGTIRNDSKTPLNTSISYLDENLTFQTTPITLGRDTQTTINIIKNSIITCQDMNILKFSRGAAEYVYPNAVNQVAIYALDNFTLTKI